MKTSGRLPTAALFGYAALGLPLAMTALPVYVHLPKFYASAFGLSLSGIGVLLLLTRALDALQDPLLGWWSDRLADRGAAGRTRMIAWAAPLLGLGLLVLFNPPAGLARPLLWSWITAALVLTYFAYSALTISYTALAADLSAGADDRTRLAGTREALGLVGVMIAAATPELLARSYGAVTAYRWFSVGLVPVLVVACLITQRSARRTVAAAGTLGRTGGLGGSGDVGLDTGGLRRDQRGAATASTAARPRFEWGALWRPLGETRFRHLLAVYLLSGTAAAIPASLVLFYIQDVIARPDLSGAFLVAYFLAGALGMPVWVALARRIGKPRAWASAMALAIAAFVWAFFLRAGDAGPYLAVCVAAGLAFGGDLALPPSLLSDLVDASAAVHAAEPVDRIALVATGTAGRQAPSAAGAGAATAPSAATAAAGGSAQGAWFGIWALTGKLNLALAAGLSLPLLGAMGYVPGAPITSTTATALAGAYALLPCLLKSASLALLWVRRKELEPVP